MKAVKVADIRKNGESHRALGLLEEKAGFQKKSPFLRYRSPDLLYQAI
jgi:hypothetical protein